MDKTYTDNALIATVRTLLLSSLVDSGYNTTRVLQKQQPSQQGVTTDQAVYLEKLFDHRHGSPRSVFAANGDTGEFEESTIQMVETTFQVSAHVLQKASDLSIPTASDLANHVAMIFGSRSFLRRLQELDIGVMRTTRVRNTYFTNDMSRQEAVPSFDLVLSYQKLLVVNVDKVSLIEGSFLPLD